MSENTAKVINRRNSSKDFESCRFDLNDMDLDHPTHDHYHQVCENCVNEKNQKKEACIYCSSYQKLKEILQSFKNESPKRDYDTIKLTKLPAKEIDVKSQNNSNSRGFSIDSISLESYDYAEKVAMKLYCKECVELSRFRIIQNKLVYITGLAPEIASEKVLQKPEYLGQYGKIAKILVNNNHSGTCGSACVVYCKEDEALTAILALDQFNLSDKTIRACSGNLLCCLNSLTCENLPYICAGGCVDLNLLERDSGKDGVTASEKSVQLMTYIPRLQHILLVLSKQPHEQKTEESVFPSINCIIQNIKKILSDYSKNEEQPTLNLRAEEKEGENHTTKTDSKPIVRKGLRLPDKKTENQFSYLSILDKFNKDREQACTETMTVVSSTETCETNRSKYTENETDTTLNENDEEFDGESPLSTMKHSNSEFKLHAEDLTIKRFISGPNNEDSARNSLIGSQRYDLLASPSKSVSEEDNEAIFADLDKKISEAIFEKPKQRNESRFLFAKLPPADEEAEFASIAFSIKRHTTPIEFKPQPEETLRICGSEIVKTSRSYFDIGEKPETSIAISENEQNMQQIEAFLHKLKKPSAAKLKSFNLNANNFVPTSKSQAKKPEIKKEQQKASPSTSDASKKKTTAATSSTAGLANGNHLKIGRPNKINNSYYEIAETSYLPYYVPSSYEAELLTDMHSYMQEWAYGPPVGALTLTSLTPLSYQDLYFLPYY